METTLKVLESKKLRALKGNKDLSKFTQLDKLNLEIGILILSLLFCFCFLIETNVLKLCKLLLLYYISNDA